MPEFLGEFEHLVLLAVARLGRDGYGMTIRREIESRTKRPVSIGAVYTTLDRLEKKRLVASRVGASTPQRGGRARRHFEVLEQGALALRDARRILTAMWKDVSFDPTPRKT